MKYKRLINGLVNEKGKSIFLALIYMFIGSTITVYINKVSSLNISNVLYWPDLISIAITIILAMYVGNILEKGRNVQRCAKDTVIVFYKEYSTFLQDNINRMINDNIELSTRNSLFKSARTRFYNLRILITSNNLIDKENKNLIEIENQITILWKKCTDKKEIDDKDKEKIQLMLIKIESLIYNLILEINNG
ncbi:MAG: hypothetical protein N4A63_13340 [Vallitalea sp.]|jgi:hypothetical protein|nr:hypothetical protein [Vallitalea sp.]